MLRASDILGQAAKDGVVQHQGALTDRQAKSLSALGVLAWKAGAMGDEHDGEWKIDRKVFAEAYGWDPDSEPSDGEYYFDDFDELPHEKQEEIESLALLGSKVRNFMNLPDEVVKKGGLDPYEVSAENIGDFLTVLNDKLKWPFARIAERFSQSGL